MKYLLATLCALVCIPTLLFAQTLGSDLSVDIVPSNPQPGQTVTLTAKSYSVDINQATLSWNYNGKAIAQGVGKTSVSVVAPNAGVPAVVTVTMGGLGMESTSASVVLRPASVDLLWEAADAYTPPFYKGKALVPVGGILRFTAIPSASAPKSLSYTWERNGSALADVSGYGKSSILIRNDALNPQESIDVSATTGTFSGVGSIKVAPYAPLAIAYKTNDGFIDYANGNDSTIRLTTPGTVLHFEPYYFSTPGSITSDLAISTTVDGESVTTVPQNELALSRPDNATQSTLKLAIATVAYSLQHLEKTFTLLFN